MILRRGARQFTNRMFALLPAMRHRTGVSAPRTHGAAAAIGNVHGADEGGAFICFFLEGFAGAAAAKDEEDDQGGDEEHADCDAGCYAAFCGCGETAVGLERVTEGEELGCDDAR